MHLRRGQELLDKSKFAGARDQIDAAIESRPSDVTVYIRAIDAYRGAMRWGDAAEVGELLAERARQSLLKPKLTSSQMAGLYAMIGSAYWMANDRDAAEAAYLNALKLAPDSGALMNDLSYLYAESGTRLQYALELARKAVRQDPNNGAWVDSLGWVQYKLRDYRTAIRTLERAVRLSPDEGELRYHLAAAYAKAGRRTESRIELGKASALHSPVKDSENLVPRATH
jgi:tetratricopeptide (TPR) repeat protein